MVKIKNVLPSHIENESFAIIDDEFESQTGIIKSAYEFGEYDIVRRVIHATGDFNIAKSIHFSEKAIEKAVSKLSTGANIYTDVNMSAAGISKYHSEKYSNQVQCYVSDTKTVQLAKSFGITRSEAAIDIGINDSVGIIAIGNAPTALLKVISLHNEGKLPNCVVIGVPVGFVNAQESKELLVQSGIDHITCTGRRGGSPVAAAMVNALYRLIA